MNHTTDLSYTTHDTQGGLAVEGGPSHEPQQFTPEELVAMVLTHAKDITKAYGGVPVTDAVLIVPCYYTQPERQVSSSYAWKEDRRLTHSYVYIHVQALLDAAEVAQIKVLGLIDENTAAALLFAVDNIYEKPTNVIFYNLGASSLQVSIDVTLLLLSSYLCLYTHIQVSLMEFNSTMSGSGSNAKRIGNFQVKAKAWDETLGGFQVE